MILSVKQLTKTFRQGDQDIEVLKGINFTMERGDRVAIVGKSGSGKSTLLSLIAGLDHPTSGDVTIGDRNISRLSEKELTRFRAEQVGIIFQHFYLLGSLTALENVALPLELTGQGEAKKRAKQALIEVGLEDRFHRLPQKLSGGEQQRVAIARAIVTKPTLLLGDEPSGFLDSETGDAVMNLLFKLSESQKMSLLLVTHSTELAARCTRTLKIHAGQMETQAR